MQFCFYPTLENSCGNVRHCPHLGGAAIGTLVHIANCSRQTLEQLYRQLDAERLRIQKLVDENLQHKKELEQAKLELKLERQNKFATGQQKNSEAEPNSAIAQTASTEEPKKNGAPVGHPGWFRPTPTEFDWAIEVPAPKRCSHCDGNVSSLGSNAFIEHLQEDIMA